MKSMENALIDVKGIHEVDWRGKKKKSREYAEICLMLANANRGKDDVKAKKYYDMYLKIKDCGSCLLFGKKKGAPDLEKKLLYANFCKDRFCPVCMWRRSIKLGYQLKKTLERSIELYPDSRFIFLTLTEKNIQAEDLQQSIKEINAAYSRMFHYKRLVNNVVLGTVRATECTYNRKRRDFNLHIHVLIQVEDSYFDKSEDFYIDQLEWQRLWKKAARLNYEPVVDVRVVYANENSGKDSLSSAVAEVAKYEVKSFEFIDIKHPKLSMKLIDTYSIAFKGVRGLGLSGVLRKIKLDLFGRLNDDELVHSDESRESDLADGDIVFIQYRWNYQVEDYLEVEACSELIEYVMSRRKRRYA